jgi:hypothetical protein
MVRAYVEGKEVPVTEPPSDPPSDPPEESEGVVTSARGRIVEVPPDYTIRPRRTLHQKIKELHKVWLALVPLTAGVIGAVRPLWNAGSAMYQWVQGVNAAMSVASAAASAEKRHGDAIEELRAELRADIADAGAAQGRIWDQQDEINLNVHKQLNHGRPQTPPPALGPKAKGRQ